MPHDAKVSNSNTTPVEAPKPCQLSVVIVDRSHAAYAFCRRFLPVMRYWGFKPMEIDISEVNEKYQTIADSSVIVLAQENSRLASQSDLVEALAKAAAGGAGIVNFDHTCDVDLDHEGRLLFGPCSGQLGSSTLIRLLERGHFVGAMQRHYVDFRLKRPLANINSPLRTGDIALLADEFDRPILVLRTGRSRIANWRCSSWIWANEFLGFGRGFDAFFWRTIVWASKRPFALMAFPPLGRLRIDDCRALTTSAEDISFIDVLAEFGERPNLGICVDKMQPSGWTALAERARLGQVDVSPHLLRPDLGIYDGKVDDAELALSTAARIATTFRSHRCPMSQSVSDHNHVFTAQGRKIASALGMKYRMNVMRLGELWEEIHHVWQPFPFGKMNFALDQYCDAPELFTLINHHYSFEDTFVDIGDHQFLCTEYGGYSEDRWDFLNGLVNNAQDKNLEGAIVRLQKHAELCLTSLFFCGSITHTHYSRYLSSADWRRLLTDYRGYVDQFGYQPASYDKIAAYAFAHHKRTAQSNSSAPGSIWWLEASESLSQPLTWRLHTNQLDVRGDQVDES
jgi:hypothetical protein